ncbi:MAG TPA: HEPN domain-containing protein [Thermoplasmata archaeon]|nr:HEPN domain-containing protein [Thermoplasmata archaeon]
MSGRKPELKDFRKVSQSIERAAEWLQDAERHLELARREERDDHAESVAHSSKAVEFSAKSLLVLAGWEFPRSHEIGIGLERVWQSLSGTDADVVSKGKRHIARVGWLSDVVAPLQSISEYGFAGKSPTRLVNEGDAITFRSYGAEAVGIAQSALNGVKDGSLKLS